MLSTATQAGTTAAAGLLDRDLSWLEFNRRVLESRSTAARRCWKE